MFPPLKNYWLITLLLLSGGFTQLRAQYVPANLTPEEIQQADQWVNDTYNRLSNEDRVGQLFIVALYTNKGEQHIREVKNLVENEKLGGIILMQDDAAREIELVNELQHASRIPLLVGMDAEWGLYQRITKAHKFPWAIVLGAIQDNHLIYEMASKIAEDAKRMGVNWVFAPVVDVNTNPNNPVIGNRSFGSNVQNVTAKGLAYVQGLQDHGVLAAIKHFPGHGDTSTDSHLDLPVVKHNLTRLNEVELAPFKDLMNQGVGGVMIAHLYVPALEKQTGVPSTVSQSIITDLLKEKLGYKGLVITDALNMGAVARRYKAGELDELAFAAGEDIMLFSQDAATGKQLILKALANGSIPQSRLEESVKKILRTKYYLGLLNRKDESPVHINRDLNNETHDALSEKLYAHALTLLQNKKDILPLRKNETVYYVPLEEGAHWAFEEELDKRLHLRIVPAAQSTSIPDGAKVIVGFHKDNSSAYKPYKISNASKNVLTALTKKHRVILDVFGSPYALRDVDISGVEAVLVSYENSPFAMKAAAKALLGETKIQGRLPVVVNPQLQDGAGLDL